MWKNTVTSMILLICTQANVLAEPVVIYDSGHTQPMQFHIKPIQFSFAPPPNLQFKISGLPVSTPSMSSGTVYPRQINKPHLTQPIFIVGADIFSNAWLQKHKERLKALNAIGIAVNVKNQKQLNILIASAGGIPISPVSGEVIATQLSLKNYPALISANRIEQ